MHPTIDFDFLELPVYTTLVMLGIIAGLSVANVFLRTHSRRAASLPVFLTGALVVLVASWIGARVYHVATHWDYYAVRTDEIAQMGLGGLAMRGGLIAGALALALYARVHGWRFARLADAAVIGLAAGQAIGWAGALVHGANYGVVSDSQLAMDLPDIYGLYAPRFPLQLAEIILFAGVFIGLVILAARKPKAGTLGIIYLLVSSTGNWILGFQRGDEAMFWGGLRIDQWIDASLACIALLFWFVSWYEGNVGIKQ